MPESADLECAPAQERSHAARPAWDYRHLHRRSQWVHSSTCTASPCALFRHAPYSASTPHALLSAGCCPGPAGCRFSAYAALHSHGPPPLPKVSLWGRLTLTLARRRDSGGSFGASTIVPAPGSYSIVDIGEHGPEDRGAAEHTLAHGVKLRCGAWGQTYTREAGLQERPSHTIFTQSW